MLLGSDHSPENRSAQSADVLYPKDSFLSAHYLGAYALGRRGGEIDASWGQKYNSNSSRSVPGVSL